MAKGEGGMDATPPPKKKTRFIQFFSEIRRAYLQTKLLSVDLSLSDLYMKKFFRSDLPSYRRVLCPLSKNLTYFSNH